MDAQKRIKLERVLKELAAEFISIHSSNASMITVTNCVVAENMRKADILVSVLPNEMEGDALSFLKRKRQTFKNYVQSHARLRIIPHLDFEIDMGEKNRQNLEKLLNE